MVKDYRLLLSFTTGNNRKSGEKTLGIQSSHNWRCYYTIIATPLVQYNLNINKGERHLHKHSTAKLNRLLALDKIRNGVQ